MPTNELNARTIEADLQWLQAVMYYRMEEFFNPVSLESMGEPEAPATDENVAGAFYTEYLRRHQLTVAERLVLLIALAAELQPELLDCFFVKNSLYDKPFTEFGGILGQSSNRFVPTLKTALFVLGGYRLSEQLNYTELFAKSGKLFAAGILQDLRTDEGCPGFERQLGLSESALSYILTGEDVEFKYSAEFPARLLTTAMEWGDLVLPEATAIQLKELLVWPEHGKRLIDELGMAKIVQPGYRALFYGPPGTGKTLTAALLAKRLGKPVYRVDLSQLVSKYIGETEKNLEKIFTAAEHRDWILFFDEADALFGKRTGISSSNDRFANQETAYLLQRLEVCGNIVILATNLKSNLDEAYTRRFQSMVFFPPPGEAERLCLWWGAFSTRLALEERIDLREIAKKYDIAGGAIVNAVRYATLMTLANGKEQVAYRDLMEGIRREYTKLGRTM